MSGPREMIRLRGRFIPMPRPVPEHKISSAAGFLFLALLACPAHAQTANATYGDLAKLPDYSGTWLYDPHRTQVASGEPIPLTPAFQKKMDAIHAINKTGGDVPARAYHCMPRGVPEVMELITRLYEFMVTPGLVTVIPQNNEVRFIYTDGRGHPDKTRYSYNGHSIGHWEGDKLVIDTNSIAQGVDMFYGFPSGGKMHVVERLYPAGPDKLQMDKMVEDSVTLTAPYGYSRSYTRHREWQVLEEICVQNNRDLDPNSGGQTFNLEMPK